MPYCITGFSLHDELELYVRAGLSPIEALRTATYNPAKFFGKLDSMGTVEQGKLADLVLLEANPLEDIRNTQKIAAVIINGIILFIDIGYCDMKKKSERKPVTAYFSVN